MICASFYPIKHNINAMIVGAPGIFKLLAEKKSSRVISKNCGGALDKVCEDAQNEGYK